MPTLKGDVVFSALTRPQMFAGVTYSYFILNGIVTTELFLLLKSFLILLVALVIHVAGVMACLRDPRIFDLWITRITRTPRVKNRPVWGCNSYRP